MGVEDNHQQVVNNKKMVAQSKIIELIILKEE